MSFYYISLPEGELRLRGLVKEAIVICRYALRRANALE